MVYVGNCPGKVTQMAKMYRVKYEGNAPGQAAEISVEGVIFTRGETVDVSKEQFEVLKDMPGFVAGSDSAPAVIPEEETEIEQPPETVKSSKSKKGK